ncbi:cytochrome c biogenesis CcdA family protein [Pseudonocardia sp. MH-G8]|uniref:cytochrome c biogenesis CcdA family protein n=1 Tax=Pseudonocardia sp. MH-G8 TaxID=1854588 RepID=UPI000B9FF8C0|nr:cytochrome c biogenesis protein CcdA [Pseudonocardia sp. MH-G8]OZM76437.1 cytochrome C biogenesis protein [Pseudonocardia sp. MH-G8]
MVELLLGTTLLASFLGGVVALLAPCCVSVMLPAYLATGFRHHGGVVPATLVFGAGVATVILPIGLGATALSRLLIEQHTVVFLVGGALMLVGGLAMLAGWKPNLPMPSARSTRPDSFRSAYFLGMFSGVASACCAPVLAGVAMLAGAAASFPVALGIGLAYVAGMVAPLALVALLWDRHQDRLTPLLAGRQVSMRIGRWRHRLPLGNALAGGLMIVMGALAGVLAFAGTAMATEGWQLRMSAWLQHASSVAVESLSWLPGWLIAAALIFGVVVLLRRARRSRTAPAATPPAPTRVEEIEHDQDVP